MIEDAIELNYLRLFKITVQFVLFYRKPGVHSFGIWRYLTFKVFISKTADDENLKVELMKINKIFFSKYPLEIEKRKLMEKPTMKQGDPLLSKIRNLDENYTTGTLGGFVTKTDDARKIYAITCNHVFHLKIKLPIQKTPEVAMGLVTACSQQGKTVVILRLLKLWRHS